MAFAFNLDTDDLSLPVSVRLIPYEVIVKGNGFRNTIAIGQNCLLTFKIPEPAQNQSTALYWDFVLFLLEDSIYFLFSFFEFLKLIYFNWRLITLQYFGGFCHISTWISHGCTCVSPPSIPLPSLGCPGALALSALLHASNLDWWSISHMVTYMFLCYSLKSSQARLLP